MKNIFTFRLASIAAIATAPLFAQTTMAATCPCFNAQDLQGSVASFQEGVEEQTSAFPFEKIYTTYELILEDGRQFRTQKKRQKVHGIENWPTFSCKVGAGYISTSIEEAEYIACAYLLSYIIPESTEELQFFDDQIMSITGALHNSATGRYLTVNSDQHSSIITQPHAPSASLWNFVPEACPTSQYSATRGTPRTCFSLRSEQNNNVLVSTNGVHAISEAPPAHVINVYILDDIVCDRRMNECSFRISVAFYGDTFIADLEDGSAPLKLGQSQDRDSAQVEWTFYALQSMV